MTKQQSMRGGNHFFSLEVKLFETRVEHQNMTILLN